MSVFATCPSCKVKLDISESLLGTKVRCGSCSTIFEARQDPLEAVTGVQADTRSGSTPLPPPELLPPRQRDELDDDHPGEEAPDQARYIRRDIEPHRGGTIVGLGIGSVVCAVGTCFCIGMPIIGIALGVAAIVMASGDLAKIKLGTMDPDGQAQTNAGFICGIVGCIFAILGLIGMAIYIAFIINMAMQQT
jgi:predicted Zn finger-like uncharacterized protein